jgi:hypothetical protein
MSDQQPLPERINPAGMARMLNMSRARLYQLIDEGIFPAATRDEDGRPYFTQEQQVQMLAAYRSNVGVNGKSIFFRPKSIRTAPPARVKKIAKTQDHTELLKSIRALGMSHVKNSQLEKALSALYPNGVLPNDQAVLVRQVFVYLHSQESSDKQGQ